MKNRTVFKSCYNKKRRKNITYNTSTQNQQPQIQSIKNNNDNDNNPSVSAYENHRHVVTGPSNVGKTFHMLKILEKIGDKIPIHIKTQSHNQYPNEKTSNEIEPRVK